MAKVTAKFRAEAVKAIRATKETKGTIGVSLIATEYADGSRIIKARAKGVLVGITVDAEGKCAYMASKSFERYEADSAMLNDSIYQAVVKYLDAKYSLRDRAFDALWKIAESGINLMTKAELKASKAA